MSGEHPTIYEGCVDTILISDRTGVMAGEYCEVG